MSKNDITAPPSLPVVVQHPPSSDDPHSKMTDIRRHHLRQGESAEVVRDDVGEAVSLLSPSSSSDWELAKLSAAAAATAAVKEDGLARACELVQQILNQVTLGDSPPENEEPEGVRRSGVGAGWEPPPGGRLDEAAFLSSHIIPPSVGADGGFHKPGPKHPAAMTAVTAAMDSPGTNPATASPSLGWSNASSTEGRPSSPSPLRSVPSSSGGTPTTGTGSASQGTGSVGGGSVWPDPWPQAGQSTGQLATSGTVRYSRQRHVPPAAPADHGPRPPQRQQKQYLPPPPPPPPPDPAPSADID